MKRLQGYIKSAIYNIKRNKAYASFCIMGSALTFVFVSIVLQLTNDIVNDSPPFVNAENEIVLSNFQDRRGYTINGIPTEEIPLILNNIGSYEYCAIKNQQFGTIFINDKAVNGLLSFVNSDFFKINEFDFIVGRPFTEEEVEEKIPTIVISKSFAKANLKTNEVLGSRIKYADVTYTVIGMIDDFSSMAGGGIEKIIVPYTFNKFLASSNRGYNLFINPKDGLLFSEFKEKVAKAFNYSFETRGIDINFDVDKIKTLKESRINFKLLSYGIPVILFILLLIPAINIIVISIANANNRAKEIAIRRAMGATIFSSFLQIMVENLLLVVIGTLVGVALAVPTANLVGNLFLNNGLYGDLFIITKINYLTLVVGILPLSLLFTLISGGIPAYLVAKEKIAITLKGGSKC